MTIPKPHPPKPALVIVEPGIPVSLVSKPVFVRNPHLVAYPFWDNEELKALKETLPTATPTRRPRRK